MKKKVSISILAFALSISIFSPCFIFAQNGLSGPVTVGQQMPDFTLPIYQGGELTLSKLKGKMVMLIFPRGKYKPAEWCHFGIYKYVELCEFEKEKKLKEEFDLEIFYVISYSREKIDDWFDKFPKQLSDIERWKNPANAENLTGRRKEFMERVRRSFPKKYDYKGAIPKTLPILVDADAAVAKGLGLHKPGWDRGEGPQNIPTVFIIDKKGKLQFKYHSQNTWDRPPYDYLLKVFPCADYWSQSD